MIFRAERAVGDHGALFTFPLNSPTAISIRYQCTFSDPRYMCINRFVYRMFADELSHNFGYNGTRINQL